MSSVAGCGGGFIGLSSCLKKEQQRSRAAGERISTD